MDFLTLAKTRCSIRNFTDEKIDGEKLNLILEAGRAAPTAANRQPQRIIVVCSSGGMAKLNKAANTFSAPLALIVCADKNEVWTRRFDGKKTYDIDASIVTDHMMLEAASLGLGSVWICSFDTEVIRTEFHLPENIEPVNILAIGVASVPSPSPDRHAETRKPLSQTVFFETLT